MKNIDQVKIAHQDLNLLQHITGVKSLGCVIDEIFNLFFFLRMV